jgi:hypothetical protein
MDLQGDHFLGERLGSGDGERKTLLTRQIASEPLPASVLFCNHLESNEVWRLSFWDLQFLIPSIPRPGSLVSISTTVFSLFGGEATKIATIVLSGNSHQ